MKKKTIAPLIIAVIISTNIFASFDNYMTLNFEYSYDTNVFSSPLPQFEQFDPNYTWLKWRVENPFIKRHSLGLNFTYDGYVKDSSRVGLSVALAVKFPIQETNYIPEAYNQEIGFGSGWDYTEFKNNKNFKTAIFGAVGPTFRAQFKYADVGIAIRLSLGAYTYEDNELILGIQVEPYCNLFINDMFYVSFKFTYDGHLLRFIKDENKIFDPYYQMLTAAPSIGLGIKF